jgi:hypothetical protein
MQEQESSREPNRAATADAVAAVLDAAERVNLIAQLAYFHAEQREFAPGGELEDWLLAEAEVEALLAENSRAIEH